MPGMNGKQLYQKLSQLRPGLKVLYMSGYTSDIIAKHGVLELDIAFLQKPFSVADLSRAARDVLDGKVP